MTGKKYKKCLHCNGTGYHKKIKCPQCKGSGKILIKKKLAGDFKL